MPQPPSHPFNPSARPFKPPSAVLAEAEQQWIFTEDELLRTPSIIDGMAPEEERERRNKGVNFITQVGIMLKLPQTTLTAAAVFFQRFLMRKSFVSGKAGKGMHHYVSKAHYAIERMVGLFAMLTIPKEIAATSLFLATKVEETCRRIKELVIACCRVAQKNPSLLVDEQTKDFWRWKDTILFTEDVLLETLCFDLSVESPYNILYDLLKQYNAAKNKPLRNAAWGFINDSNLTQLCLLFTSRTIAATALYFAAKQYEVSFPDDDKGRPWWQVQNVRLTDVRKACNYMADLYSKPPRSGTPNIYVRTPEDGGEEFAKTRMKREHLGDSPSPGFAMERSGSSQSLKRGRDDLSFEVENGELKKLKLSSDGEADFPDRSRGPYPKTGNGADPSRREDRQREEAKRPNGYKESDEAHTSHNVDPMEVEDGSEEGELEE